MMNLILTLVQVSIVVPVVFTFARGLYLIYLIYTESCGFNDAKQSLRTIFCVGSGGHTSELLKLISQMDMQIYRPRLYIMADTDNTSETKIIKFENNDNNYKLSKIPRSRNVNQSFKSSVFSTLYAIYVTIPLIYKFNPNLIFCNGPGTCVPICIVAFIMRCLFLIDCRIVFVESVCRVRTLSLTGNILQFFVDVFVVQWPQVHKVCFRSKYYGRLT
ncbi:UDP-N-acetylglucosamine transferase subunit ALG14 homolog [Pieris napi]|uniref:UDP-N-acetylglucosamine transferase subunit ALG14 homolog n=1 Tax=Pieris napi TaxID=78633 RepID=UPI001FB8C36B|nr:UDP-N-acetylglucosamine transferase subunit ALG14 homolog [Pieris napi]